MSEKYRIIYADPPWEYDHRIPGGAADHYDVMDIDAICGLGEAIKPVTADQAVCLMWFTGTHTEEAYRVMRAWGFKPIKPIFVWVKTTTKGKLFPGQGRYTSSNAEYILLGRKGPYWTANRRTSGGPGVAVPEVVLAPHPRDAATKKIIHSAKPDIFRQHIVRLFGDVPRVELFARERANGWASFGNHLPEGGQIIRSDEPLPSADVESAAKVVPLRPQQLRLAL